LGTDCSGPDGASGPIDFGPQGDPSAGNYSLWHIVRGDDGKLAFELDETVDIAFQLN
jgi:hypothetical protein